MEHAEERISNLEDRTMGITWPERQEEERLKKMNRALGTFATRKKELPFMFGESWKEKGKRTELKTHSETSWMKIFPMWQTDMNLQIQESEQTPNRINLKKPMLTYIIIKLLKYKEKHKSWKQRERNNILPIGRKQFEWQWISHQKPWRSEGRGTRFFKCWKKKNCQPRIS